MSDPTSQEALLERIRQLEIENKEAKSELNTLKMKLNAKAPLTIHEFELQELNRTAEFDGIKFECFFRKRATRHEKDYISLHAKCIDTERFVYAITDVFYGTEEDKRYSFGNRMINSRTQVCRSTPHRFTLRLNEEYVGEKQCIDMRERCEIDPWWKIAVRVTVIVQPLDSTNIDCNGSNRIVVVKGKEFRVSAEYLSLWSGYFRKYFNKNQNQDDICRLEDDVEPEEFQLLLDVILPTDKPITDNNFKLLLRMASRFEMPSLTRRIELFIIDFAHNGLDRATAFGIAIDLYDLSIVKMSLLHRWRDPELMEKELLKSSEYKKLSAKTRALVNQRFTQARIGQLDCEEMRTQLPLGLQHRFNEDEGFSTPDDEAFLLRYARMNGFTKGGVPLTN